MRDISESRSKWGDRWFDFHRLIQVLSVIVRALWDAERSRGERGSGAWAASLRIIFERLGLTYLKLGQYLALRMDLFPEQVRTELEHLFENVQPVEFDRVRTQVECELGAPLEQYFPDFDPLPIASASIAQVHLARTASGRRVAVKVQRPNIERVFESDIRLMRRFARLADMLKIAGIISITEAVEQFAVWTRRELDFVMEGGTAERLCAGANGKVVIPKIHWGLTSRRVLTMDFIEGVSLAEVSAALGRGDVLWLRKQLPGVDLGRAFSNLAQICLRQIFVERFFHGDPHPGNILITPEGRTALVDFGIVGELTVRERDLLSSYLSNLIVGRPEESFQSYSQLFTFGAESDYRGFRNDLICMMREWYALASNPDAPAEERLAAKFADRNVAVSRAHHVLMNMDLLLFWRVFIVLDAVAARLSARLNLMVELGRFFSSRGSEALTNVESWVPDCHRAVESASRLAVTLSRLAPGLRPGLEIRAWIDPGDDEDHNANRHTVSIAMFISGVSASIAVGAYSPSAVWVLVAAWCAASIWYLWKRT